jgi:hypothetical protein
LVIGYLPRREGQKASVIQCGLIYPAFPLCHLRWESLVVDNLYGMRSARVSP